MDLQQLLTWIAKASFFLAAVLFILGIMLMIPGIQVSVYAIPVWLLVMWGCYRLKLSSSAKAAQAYAAS